MTWEANRQKRQIDAGGVPMDSRITGLVRRFLSLMVMTVIVCGAMYPSGKTASALLPLTLSAAFAEAAGPAGDVALQKQYDEADALFTAKDYAKAYEAFTALGSYADSHARAADSQKKWIAAQYAQAVDAFKNEQFAQAKALFESLENYKDSRSYLYKSKMGLLRAQYQQAKDAFASGDYQKARDLFTALGTFNNSKERALEADELLKAEQKAQAEQDAYNAAIALKASGNLPGARDAFIEAGPYQDATDQVYAIFHELSLQALYDKADTLAANDRPQAAAQLFAALGDFADSAAKAEAALGAWRDTAYEQAAALKASDVNRAYLLYLALGDHQNSATLAETLKADTTPQGLYAAAEAIAQDGDLSTAIIGFEAISAFGDSPARAAALQQDATKSADYDRALYLKAIGEQQQANDLFQALGDYRDAPTQIAKVLPPFTAQQLRDDRTSPMSAEFIAPDGSSHRYRIYKGVRTWVEAKAFCEVLGGHLATLTTAEENAYVHAFMIDSGYLTAYFGLSDEKRVGNWIWVTGEPFEYSNWRKGQPSRSAKERYGMYFYKHLDGTWNDSHFYETVKVDPGCSYICEWDD